MIAINNHLLNSASNRIYHREYLNLKQENRSHRKYTCVTISLIYMCGLAFYPHVENTAWPHHFTKRICLTPPLLINVLVPRQESEGPLKLFWHCGNCIILFPHQDHFNTFLWRHSIVRTVDYFEESTFYSFVLAGVEPLLGCLSSALGFKTSFRLTTRLGWAHYYIV